MIDETDDRDEIDRWDYYIPQNYVHVHEHSSDISFSCLLGYDVWIIYSFQVIVYDSKLLLVGRETDITEWWVIICSKLQGMHLSNLS